MSPDQRRTEDLDCRIHPIAEKRKCAQLPTTTRHPVPPCRAQGGCTAIEDAVGLAACLDAADVPETLRRYASLRQGRTRRIQLGSRSQGTLYHLSGAKALARNVGLRSDAVRLAPIG